MFAEVAKPPRSTPLPDEVMFPEVETGDGRPGRARSRLRRPRPRHDRRRPRVQRRGAAADPRARASQFYLGLIPELDDETRARSTIVATEVRDTILQMLPSLMRIFTAQDSTVNFIPNDAKAAPPRRAADRDYLSYVFSYDNPGYMILQDVFKDGLHQGDGRRQWWTDDNLEVRRGALRAPHPRAAPVRDRAARRRGRIDGARASRRARRARLIPIFDLTIRRTKRAPKHWVARCRRTSSASTGMATCGQDRRSGRARTLRDPDRAAQEGHPSRADRGEPDFSGGDHALHRGAHATQPGGSTRPSAAISPEPSCAVGEYWIRIDKDGDGLAELRHICTIGDNDIIVIDEPALAAEDGDLLPRSGAAFDRRPRHRRAGRRSAGDQDRTCCAARSIQPGPVDLSRASGASTPWSTGTTCSTPPSAHRSGSRIPNAIGQLAYTFIGEAGLHHDGPARRDPHGPHRHHRAVEGARPEGPAIDDAQGRRDDRLGRAGAHRAGCPHHGLDLHVRPVHRAAAGDHRPSVARARGQAARHLRAGEPVDSSTRP